MAGRLPPAILLGLVLLAPTAWAHAQLVSSEPPFDPPQVLERAPPEVRLVFSEHLDHAASALRVLDVATSREVQSGPVSFSEEPPAMSVPLPPDLPPGSYLVRFLALSSDDAHPNDGFFGFAVGNFTPQAGSSGDVNHVEPAGGLARALLYAGFSLALGAAAFLVWMRPAGYPMPLLAKAMLWGTSLHLAGVALLARQTATAARQGMDTLLLSPTLPGQDPWSVGHVLALRLVLAAGAWLLAVLAWSRPSRSGPWAVAFVMALAALATARQGHAFGEGPSGYAIDAVHLAAASVWAGGLLLFVALLRRGLPMEEVRGLGVRFGTLALTMVILVAGTGLVLVVYILGAGALDVATWRVAYGGFLAGKVALALAMVGLAGINRYVLLEQPKTSGLAGLAQKTARLVSAGRLRPGLADGSSLRRSISLEATLGVCVLVLAGFLTSVSPPAVEAEGGLVVQAQGANFVVHMTATPPPAHGSVSAVVLDIRQVAADGTLATLANNTCGRPTCVDIEVRYGSDPTPQALSARLDGAVWRVPEVLWAASGPANVTVNISAPPVFHEDVRLGLTVA